MLSAWQRFLSMTLYSMASWASSSASASSALLVSVAGALCSSRRQLKRPQVSLRWVS